MGETVTKIDGEDPHTHTHTHTQRERERDCIMEFGLDTCGIEPPKLGQDSST